MKSEEYGVCGKCRYHHYASEPGEQIEVTIGGAYKPLQQNCHYCLMTPRTKKIGSSDKWTGRTPSWCPLRKEG